MVSNDDTSSSPRTALGEDGVMVVSGEWVVGTDVEVPIRVDPGGALFLLGSALAGVTVGDGGYARIDGQTTSAQVTGSGHLTLRGVCHGPVVCEGGRLLIQGDIHGPVIAADGEILVGAAARLSCAGIHLPLTPPSEAEPTPPPPSGSGR